MRQFLFFLFLITACVNASAQSPFPSWVDQNAAIEGLSESWIVETHAHHFGMLNDKFKLIADTVWDKYGGQTYMGADEVPIAFLKKTEKNIYNDSCYGGWVVVNSKGKQILPYKLRLPFDTETLKDYSGRLCCFHCENGKWGLCGSHLKVIQRPVYENIWLIERDTISSYDKMFYLVKANGKYGLLDTCGKMVLDTIYPKAYRPSDTGAWLACDTDTIFIDGWHNWHIEYHNRDERGLPGVVTASGYRFETQMRYTPYDYLAGWESSWYSNGINALSFTCQSNFTPDPLFWEDVFGKSPDYLSCWFGYSQCYIINTLRDNPIDTTAIFSNDSLFCANYFIRGDRLFPFTLDSVFIQSDTLNAALLRRMMSMQKQKFDDADSVYLSGKFLISPGRITLALVVKNEDKTSCIPESLEWKKLADLIDPKSLFADKSTGKTKSK